MSISERPPSLLASLKDQPREAWFVYAGTLVNKFGTFVVPFLLFYPTRRGYSAAEAGRGRRDHLD